MRCATSTRLPVREVLSATHFVTDLTLGLGEVVFDYLAKGLKGTSMARFDKKVGIITGAASGIGKEIALRFAAEGGTPVIADLNLDAANATAAEIKAKGGDAFAVAMNVVDEAAVEQGRRRRDGEVRPHRPAGQQRRHPDREADRRLPLRRLEEAAGDPSRRRVPDDQGLPQAHVRRQVGQHRLHGLGAFQGGLAS